MLVNKKYAFALFNYPVGCKNLTYNSVIIKKRFVFFFFFALKNFLLNSLLFNIATSLTFAYNTFSKERMSLQDQLFIAQGRVIKDLAEKEPCVIVGSCADYFLSERNDVMNVFIHANMEFRKKTAVERYGYDPKDVQAILTRKDRERASHYRYYTEHEWASAPNYHLCLDSSMYGIEKCADIIADLYKME